jgi:hypothetical protein
MVNDSAPSLRRLQVLQRISLQYILGSNYHLILGSRGIEGAGYCSLGFSLAKTTGNNIRCAIARSPKTNHNTLKGGSGEGRHFFGP